MNNLSFLRHSLLRGFYSNPLTLVYTAGANGSVMGASPQVVDAGKDGSPVTAVASFNYRFLNWSDGVGTATRTDVNVSGNITVTANFVLLVYSVNIPVERGPHNIYVQASDSVGMVSTAPIIYVAAYELTEYGIDLYSGDVLLDAIGTILHDELLPALPTLNFSCATLLTGTIQAVIRERGIRQYQFTIDTVGLSGGIYSYTCLAAESYALTTAIMALQTAYGVTSNAIRLIAPSLNIIDASVPTHSTVNLVTNGEFEANITSWHGLSGAVVSHETGIPLVGIGSLKMVSAGGGCFAYFSHFTAVVGHSYYFTGRVKSTAAAGRKVYASTFTASGTPVDCSSVAIVSKTFTAERTFMEIGFSFDAYVADESFLLNSVVCYDITVMSFVNLLAQPTYPQLFQSIAPVDVIKQLLIQALAQASVRNGNMYVFPLDVSTRVPDYHMQRLDKLTGWQRNADTFDAVQAHYVVKQYPTPDTFLTLHDAVNWSGAVSDVTQVTDILLPVPSGAAGMLKSVGNCNRANLSVAFKDFDRIRFNWLPINDAASVTVSLLQDADNKFEMIHAFNGQIGAGFVFNTGTASTDIFTKDIILSPIRQVKMVAGTTTAPCSYRVSLFGGAGEMLWQDGWHNTISNTFKANPPPAVSEEYQITTVKIEFTDLYLIGTNYGVQAITCFITVQSYIAVGTHMNVVSSVTYSISMSDIGNYFFMGTQGLPAATSSQWYEVINLGGGPCDSLTLDSEHVHAQYNNVEMDMYESYRISVLATLRETITDYAWVPSTYVWSEAFNLFEAVNLALSDFARIGNPMNLAMIALTFTGDNYIDTLVMIADNPLPVTVRAGTGSRVYPVTDDFGSEAGAQAYADGLLPTVSVAREQYTRDVSLATDLAVGDPVNLDGVIGIVYSADYRQDGKTLAAGRAMDTLMTRLSEQSRRLGTLERKG